MHQEEIQNLFCFAMKGKDKQMNAIDESLRKANINIDMDQN